MSLSAPKAGALPDCATPRANNPAGFIGSDAASQGVETGTNSRSVTELGHNPVTAQADEFYERTRPVYPQTMAAHGPARSLDAYLAELTSRHDRLSAALRAGTRIANSQTRDELRELHSRIREVEAEIDRRAV